MSLEDVEHELRKRMDALGPAPRAELLRVLMPPDFDPAGRIGELYGDPRTRTFGELLIDLEESPHSRTAMLGDLRGREVRGR